ncbi:MAG: DUF1926 domain-containing protein [Candidatus Omnitrophica bacterium]|nr:DUF1926 domain-containing protein [Candidatus Omnitrophota bacterium]MDD5236209.1 DUF1926 domain-containing protein [Candidatus Omnitrophota bacterium]MDD5611067.1 DUF1926 domain-containing protein [Candidatus Omnitrophota bacterium]
MHKVKLLLAIHSHQPVGNFEGVFEEAYEKAYLPFLDTLARHPSIKSAFHYSGELLDWLEKKHPDFIDKLRTMVARGQIEMLAGGYYEPILPIIPEEDALGQIELLRKRIKKLFSYEASGAWLAERVWEPRTSYILGKSGLSYTLVDDSHFKFVSREPEDLSGYYISEEQGLPICIFPGSEKLRYLMPFRLPQETIDYLRMRLERSAGDVAITFADDGEKFGLWPGTHKWVYREGWLENFFNTLEQNRDWIEFITFSEYLKENPPTGKIYLTCASYREMLEWSQGYFRNFFIRYPESDNMHKKMFYVSEKLKDSAEKLGKSDFQKATDHLYRGQANDSYWHGVFGGLYLNHLRSSVYSNLIDAEKIIDKTMLKGANKTTETDINLDGSKEILLNSAEHNLYFLPHQGAALFEWDYKPRSVNLTNTIMRRPEKYHQKLKEKINSGHNPSSGIPSIHEMSGPADANLASELYYDNYPRYSLIEHFLEKELLLEEFISSRLKEKATPFYRKSSSKVSCGKNSCGVDFDYEVRSQGLSLDVAKSLRVSKNIETSYELKNVANSPTDLIFGIEFNFSLYDPALSLGSGSLRTKSLKLNDIWYGIKIDFDFEEEVLVWHFPVETISDSETGIEKTYQGLCLVFIRDLAIAGSGRRKFNFSLTVK